MEEYHSQTIEEKWQKRWEEKRLFFAAEDFSDRPKYYTLVEFPYPSGAGLHLGHSFTCTILDIFARKKRMSGFNVLYPMGWDAFGLPTENYAIRTGIHPAIATKQNTDRFRSQMKQLGFAYNWDREINTTDPKYYKWTQWIFLQLFKKGLAYKAEMPVGWCPSCKIILANEEIVNNKCERCGAWAKRRTQKQWVLKITAYADRLIDELELVDYPDYVKQSQINWVGRTRGITIDYPIVDSRETISCYSTRPDTNFGVTFVVIAPEHFLVAKLITPENRQAVEAYLEQAKKKSELERTELAKEKTGVFTGKYALNRLTNKKMPIWVADFVVLTAGTGVVVGVPAHDKRDWEFAKRYNLEIVPVVKPKGEKEWDFEKRPFVDVDQAVIFNSGFLDGLPSLEAKEKITDYLVNKGWGKRAVNYHLRDWIFSRQHYWGEPIPIIHCQKCGQVPVPENQLPVELPAVEKYQPTDTGESPLANIKEWVETACPECSGPARRETDTMPNWAGSSWYFLRYIDPQDNQALADKKKMDYWMPVDLYLGGAEHTTLHLLYSRFWHKFLNDIGVAPGKEPYFSRRQHGVILGEDGYRMSKSRGNIVNPEEVIEKFGVDALRVYLMFMGPYDQTMPWSTRGVQGCSRFLNRVWQLSLTKVCQQESSKEMRQLLEKTIQKVGEDIDNLKFNTAIAAMMEFINRWQKDKTGVSKEDLRRFLLILAPFAPHIAEELWEKAGGEFSIHEQKWPEYDPSLLKEEKITLIVEIDGRVRDKIAVGVGLSEEEAKKLALASEKVQRWLSGKLIRKVIFIPDQLINFVT